LRQTIKEAAQRKAKRGMAWFTRAQDAAYMVLTLHRALHNRMHEQGTYHGHMPVTDHAEHR
jgi:hypothetical protein